MLEYSRITVCWMDSSFVQSLEDGDKNENTF